MEPIKIDEHQAIATLRELVQGNEDFVYEPHDNGLCTYVHNGQPDCLVGQALHKLGVPLDALERIQDGDTFDPAGIGEVSDDTFELTPLATSLLAEAQRYQDTGYPWHDALQVAEGWYGRAAA